MTIKIYCINTNTGMIKYYLSYCGKEYFLSERRYRKSNYEYFSKGVLLKDCTSYCKAHGHTVRHVLPRILTEIERVEKAYGIFVFEKTKRKAHHKEKPGADSDKEKLTEYKGGNNYGRLF